MTTNNFPFNSIRAELRDWFFEEELMCYVGHVYNDTKGIFRDSQPIKFPSRSITIVDDYDKFFVLITKDNNEYVLWKHMEKK